MPEVVVAGKLQRKVMAEKKHSNALIVFARKPELGKVKTRLAATIGDERALEIYVLLLEHTRSLLAAADCDPHIFLTSLHEDPFWNGFEKHLQDGKDLGERMHHAFERLLNRGYEKVLIIGSDCPKLTESHISEAFRCLNHCDVVIGPARDGGYYLLGMKQIYHELFVNKKWSTDTVFADTLFSIGEAGLSYVEMEVLSDVDEEGDIPEGWIAASKQSFL